MCTVSIVPSPAGCRIVCNRDERRTRPIADPPTLHRLGSALAVWPTDVASGGTWIGANDDGLAMVLLNRRPRSASAVRARAHSRGTIIPGLLHLSSIESAVDAANELPLDWFEPFTLVMVYGRTVRAMTMDSVRTWRTYSLSTLLFTSSSLGDTLVAGPRQRLFSRLVRRNATPLAGQRAFHRHVWPRRPEVSVVMSRVEAATVSRTSLDVGLRGVSMHYARLTE